MRMIYIGAFVFFFLVSANAQYYNVYAVNDTFGVVFTGDTVLLDVLANDSAEQNQAFQPYYMGDNLNDAYTSWVVKQGKNYLCYSPRITHDGKDSIRYIIKCPIPIKRDTGWVFLTVRNESILSNEKIRCFISQRNANFYDNFKNENLYLVKHKGMELSSIGLQALWIAGVKENSFQIHSAGSLYNISGIECWAGPYSNEYNNSYLKKWKRTWKISKQEIEYHKNHFSDAYYSMPLSIAEWPGNGDTSLEQSAQLAPFMDVNSNGIYEPEIGDYPDVPGDEAVFFLFNDSRYPQGMYQAIPMGLEIKGVAFLFENSNHEYLSNTVYFHYKITNKSDNNYLNTMMGIFSANYNYVILGCDVMRNSFFYNNLRYSFYLSSGHDSLRIMNAIVLLGGAKLEPDNHDNPPFTDCSFYRNFSTEKDSINAYAINGINFGDGIMDNERMGLTYYNRIAGSYRSDWPSNPKHFYGCLLNSVCEIDKDSNRVLLKALDYKPYCDPSDEYLGCRFRCPGLSDICNWGVKAKPYPSGKAWFDTLCAMPYHELSVGSTGPFKFKPGETVELDFAITYSKADTNFETSFDDINIIIDSIRQNYPAIYNPVVGIHEIPISQTLHGEYQIIPNPANNEISIHPAIENATFEIFDITGKRVRSGKTGKHNISVNLLKKGYYIVRVTTAESVIVLKFIKN